MHKAQGAKEQHNVFESIHRHLEVIDTSLTVSFQWKAKKQLPSIVAGEYLCYGIGKWVVGVVGMGTPPHK